MLTKISLAWRVGFSLVWLSLCLLWAVCTTQDYWLWVLGIAIPISLLCTQTAWKGVCFMKDLFAALFAAPDRPEVERTVDGFHAALKYANNWASRNAAAAIALGSMLLMLVTKLDLPIFIVGGAATVIATHFPLILNRFEASKDKPTMFNAGAAE